MAAEDDEIDILGDFSLDGCLNKNEKNISSTYSELLKCDYTVHPQWLLDTATTSNWYDNPPQDDSAMKNGVCLKDQVSDDDNQPSTSGATIEWTIYEKELLKKGMDIYGRNYNKLSKFLGSKTVQEVQMFIEAEYGINLETDHSTLDNSATILPLGVVEYGDILTENEIPASIEEVICLVSTAEPTVPNLKNQSKPPDRNKRGNPRSVLRKDVLPEPEENRSLLKKPAKSPDAKVALETTFWKKNNYLKTVPKPSYCVEKNHESDQYLSNKPYKTERIKYNQLDTAKGTKIKKALSTVSGEKKSRIKSNIASDYSNTRIDGTSEKTKFNISLMVNKKHRFNSLLPKKRRKSLNAVKRRGPRAKSISETTGQTVMQIVMGSGHALPLSEGEQVITIEKNANSDVDTDVEIDVVSDGDNLPSVKIEPIKAQPIVKYEKDVNSDREIFSADSKFLDNVKIKVEDVKPYEPLTVINMKPLEIPDSIREVVLSMETPKQEYLMTHGEISELEKFLCPDFFEGRPAKTPERYLLIRSHLVGSWRACRPHYLTKTSARHGLRNCGDVNCIGRVHMVMEQLGAINFNCEQTNYIRPLSELLNRTTFTTPALPKVKQQTDEVYKMDVARQRKKKIVVNGDGGYTITHGEFGETCEAISEPRRNKTSKKKQTNLIYCKSFSEDHPPPYRVSVALSALILMDFHAHTSHAEVMGLLGGHYDSLHQTVVIQNYVPCDSVDNSGTHCDMCPVSQSEASEELCSLGCSTVGWHHSHPHFPPWPSAQDLHSQEQLQTALAPGPCVAIILSPHWQTGRTSSLYRCLYVKSDVSGVQNLAFRFKTHLECDLQSKESLDLLINNIRKIMKKNRLKGENYLIDMAHDLCPNANMTYLEKCISSIIYHLKLCEDNMNISWCNEIIQEIRSVVR